MTTYNLTFIGPGPWTGLFPVIEGPLSADQFNGIIWTLQQAISAIQNGPGPVSLNGNSFSVSGNLLTITLTDGSQTRIALPVSTPRFRDDWSPNTLYLTNDYFNAQGALWATKANFTSGATFEPGSDNVGKVFDYGKKTVFTVSDSQFTPTINHANGYIRLTNSGSCSLTIPASTSVAFDIGVEFRFRAVNVADIVFEGENSTVVINLPEGKNPIPERIGAEFWLKKVDVDEWDAEGRLADA